MWPQVSCRPLAFQMNLREPFTFNMAPAFAELMDRPDAVRVARYRDPAWRGAAPGGAQGQQGVPPVNWDALEVAESTAHPELIDRNVVELAAERGVTPLDVMLDVSLDENLETRFRSVLANNDPEAHRVAAGPRHACCSASPTPART